MTKVTKMKYDEMSVKTTIPTGICAQHFAQTFLSGVSSVIIQAWRGK
jgi:hypothetical protein